MDIGTFIDRLAKTKFTFSGVYYSSRPVWEERPFEVVFEIGHGGSSILVEGGVRRRHAEPPFAFEIEIPFGSISVIASSVHMRSGQIICARARQVSSEVEYFHAEMASS